MIEDILNKKIEDMSPIEYLIYKEYIKWDKKNNKNQKSGQDAISAANELDKIVKGKA